MQGQGFGVTPTGDGPHSVPVPGAESPGCPCRARAGTGGPGHQHVPSLCHGSSGCLQCPRSLTHPPWGSHHSPAGSGSQSDHLAPLGPGAGDRDPLALGAAPLWCCHCLSLLPSFALLPSNPRASFKSQNVHLSLKKFLGALILPSLLWPCRAHGLGSGSIISPLNNTPEPCRSQE